MSSPNTAPFAGFDDPQENWSKLPHEFVNRLPQFTSMSEMKVVLYILRHTWGYHDPKKVITIDEFMHGRKRKDDSRIDAGTGLSRSSVIDGLRTAVAHGFVCTSIDDSDAARIEKTYWLAQKDNDSSAEVQKLDAAEIQKLDPVQRKKQYKETKVNTSSGEQVAAAQPTTDEVETPSTVKAEEKKPKLKTIDQAQRMLAYHCLNYRSKELVHANLDLINQTLAPIYIVEGLPDSKTRTDEDKNRIGEEIVGFAAWWREKHPDLDFPLRKKVGKHYSDYKVSRGEDDSEEETDPTIDPDYLTAEELAASDYDLEAAKTAKRQRLGKV